MDRNQEKERIQKELEELAKRQAELKLQKVNIDIEEMNEDIEANSQNGGSATDLLWELQIGMPELERKQKYYEKKAGIEEPKKEKPKKLGKLSAEDLDRLSIMVNALNKAEFNMAKARLDADPAAAKAAAEYIAALKQQFVGKFKDSIAFTDEEIALATSGDGKSIYKGLDVKTILNRAGLTDSIKEVKDINKDTLASTIDEINTSFEDRMKTNVFEHIAAAEVQTCQERNEQIIDKAKEIRGIVLEAINANKVETLIGYGFDLTKAQDSEDYFKVEEKEIDGKKVKTFVPIDLKKSHEFQQELGAKDKEAMKYFYQEMKKLPKEERDSADTMLQSLNTIAFNRIAKAINEQNHQGKAEYAADISAMLADPEKAYARMEKHSHSRKELESLSFIERMKTTRRDREYREEIEKLFTYEVVKKDEAGNAIVDKDGTVVKETISLSFEEIKKTFDIYKNSEHIINQENKVLNATVKEFREMLPDLDITREVLDVKRREGYAEGVKVVGDDFFNMSVATKDLELYGFKRVYEDKLNAEVIKDEEGNIVNPEAIKSYKDTKFCKYLSEELEETFVKTEDVRIEKINQLESNMGKFKAATIDMEKDIDKVFDLDVTRDLTITVAPVVKEEVVEEVAEEEVAEEEPVKDETVVKMKGGSELHIDTETKEATIVVPPVKEEPAKEEPVKEEPAKEEPVVEEPVVKEEPVVETTEEEVGFKPAGDLDPVVKEEPVKETEAKEISIDDLTLEEKVTAYRYYKEHEFDRLYALAENREVDLDDDLWSLGHDVYRDIAKGAEENKWWEIYHEDIKEKHPEFVAEYERQEAEEAKETEEEAAKAAEEIAKLEEAEEEQEAGEEPDLGE